MSGERTVRERYEEAPYPAEPVTNRIFQSASEVYAYSAVTPFVLRDAALPPRGVRILDAGCGTGAKAVRLAAANPGASVVGIDFSQRALEIARQRAEKTGVANVQFRRAEIEELSPEEGLYDYVHCDDVLYLLDPPADGLRSLAQLLAPRGILRANVHNQHVREKHLRAGRALELLGALRSPADEAVAAAKSLYRALRPGIRLRQETSRGLTDREFLLANHALAGDKAFTLDQTLAMIEAAGLKHFFWADFPNWSLRHLFRRRARNGEQYKRLRTMDRLDRYRFIDAVHYHLRLYDFWCCRPEAVPADLDEPAFPEHRLGRRVRLHPALIQSGFLASVERSRRRGRPLDLAAFVPFAAHNHGQPAQAQDLVLLLGVHEWSYRQLHEKWRLLRPRRPEDGREHTEAETRRELFLGLEFLREAGVALALERSG